MLGHGALHLQIKTTRRKERTEIAQQFSPAAPIGPILRCHHLQPKHFPQPPQPYQHFSLHKAPSHKYRNETRSPIYLLRGQPPGSGSGNGQSRRLFDPRIYIYIYIYIYKRIPIQTAQARHHDQSWSHVSGHNHHLGAPSCRCNYDCCIKYNLLITRTIQEVDHWMGCNHDALAGALPTYVSRTRYPLSVQSCS